MILNSFNSKSERHDIKKKHQLSFYSREFISKSERYHIKKNKQLSFYNRGVLKSVGN